MLTFANPWGLLGLLAVPAVLWLHLYRVRFAPLVVGGLFLWDDAVRRPPGGRTRDRLKSTPSLWLELLAALALGLLLAGPRVRWETTGPHLVAVVDGSASMTAATGETNADGSPRTFRDRALAELRTRAAALGGNARLTVVHSGARPRVVGGPRGPWREVVESVRDDAPADGRHDLAPAVDLAARLAADGGSVLVLTDRAPDALGFAPAASVAVVGVGEPRANAALLAADRRAGDGGEELFVRARAFGAVGPATLTVADAAGGAVASPATGGRSRGPRRPSRSPCPPGSRANRSGCGWTRRATRSPRTPPPPSCPPPPGRCGRRSRCRPAPPGTPSPAPSPRCRT